MLRYAKAIALGACLAVLGACSASGGGSTGTTDASVLAAAKAGVARDFKGTSTSPPTTGPTPKRNVNVMVISCGQITDACSVPAAAAQAAGRSLGWNVSVFDGKLDPTVFNQGVRQAIATHQDAIVLDSIDCGAVRQSLIAARSAGIKIYAFYAFDCNDPAYGGGPKMFDGSTVYAQPYGSNYANLAKAIGAAEADYAIARTNGKAQVVEFTLQDIVFSSYAKKGFEEELAKCGGCRVLGNVTYAGPDIGPPLTAKAQAAFLRYPSANVSFAPVDSGAAFIAPAVSQFKASRSIVALGGEGLAANIGLVRTDRGQDLASGGGAQWIGWSAIDGVNRLLNGQAPVSSGIGILLVDREHNLPASGPVRNPIDFAAAYRQAWGLSK